MVAESWVTICFVVGTVLLAIGLPMGLSFPYIFSSLLQLQLQLTPDSASFNQWNDPPVPVFLDVYMWNWTNAVEFAANRSVVPAFEEVGPFVFRLKTKRENVTWSKDRTVTYSPNRNFIFDPDLSLDLNTRITTLSPVPAVLAYFGRFWSSPFFLALINREVQLREDIHKTESAGNWLFFGINDTLLDVIVALREVVDLPLPYNKFAWFYGRNGSSTAEGSFTILTGTDDISNLGKLTLWKGLNTTEAYSGICGEIGGSTGELIPPMAERPKSLSVFSADVCSQLTLEWAGETSESGVHGWEFSGSDLTFDNGHRHPEAACFCTGDCVPAGLRNVSQCKFGAPAFVSFPHFYLADENITSMIQGMEPNKSLHEFILKVEPTTGIPLYVEAKLQINMLVQASPSLELYRDMPTLFIPMLWFRQRAAITPDLADMLNMILAVPTIGLAVFFSVAVVGLALIFGGCYLTFKKK